MQKEICGYTKNIIAAYISYSNMTIITKVCSFTLLSHQLLLIFKNTVL